MSTRFFGITMVPLLIVLLPVAASAAPHAQPDADRAPYSLQSLARKPLAQRSVVTIYQFRSGVAAINNQAATDMFTTALIKSGQFRVAERAQLAPGVLFEKQLNQSGRSTGDSGNAKLSGAQYLFEGAVSEASLNEDQAQHGFSIGGMALGHSSARGAITIDVRIIDVATGDVLDSVNVSEPVNSSKSSASGVGSFLGNVGALSGRVAGLSPDVSSSSSHDDSLDTALRNAIEHAVYEIVQRLN